MKVHVQCHVNKFDGFIASEADAASGWWENILTISLCECRSCLWEALRRFELTQTFTSTMNPNRTVMKRIK